uniref:Mitochondrial amidoxime reducing component 2 n=1 Tax=Callithrix jacchus TaxID=9483 RepID=A0A8I3WVQ7_CALJA
MPVSLGFLAQRPPGWLGVAALGLAAVVLGAVAWRRAGPRRRRRLQQVGTVAKLWIYPVKSCKGVAVSEAECTALGLRSGDLRDRFWLVIKEDGHMVTARQEPRLVLVSITYENNRLIFRAPDVDQLVLPTKQPSSNKLYDCRIFGLDIKGRDCGNEAAQWFTNFLKTEAYRLVQFETNMKGRTSKKLLAPINWNYQVAYPDYSPLLVMTDASLVDLNTRMEKKVKMENFRPNIVVTGCDAFEEDTWDELLIGSVEVKRVMACSRCILTTVDPDSGIIDRKEPLDTLKRFWLVINQEGNMVTARQEPRLVLISLTCEGDTLTLSAAYTKDLLLPIKTPTTNAVHKCSCEIHVTSNSPAHNYVLKTRNFKSYKIITSNQIQVHSLEIEGRDCGEAAAQWITSFLKSQPYRLVHFEPHMWPRHPHQTADLFRLKDQIVYSDASPFMILSEASLADLNSRLEKKVKVTNFRPNIVISGCHVYAEDSWDELLIGDVELKRVMACSRCILTTVDPDTGVMSRKEPLETLKSYRQCDPSERKLYGKSPLFGQYFVLENPGTIRVGDPVYLLGQ